MAALLSANQGCPSDRMYKTNGAYELSGAHKLKSTSWLTRLGTAGTGGS